MGRRSQHQTFARNVRRRPRSHYAALQLSSTATSHHAPYRRIFSPEEPLDPMVQLSADHLFSAQGAVTKVGDQAQEPGQFLAVQAGG